MLNFPLFTDFLKLSQLLTYISLILLVGSFYLIKILEKKKIDFSIRMLVGLVLGIILGFAIQVIAQFPDETTIASTLWIQETILWYGLFGKAFVSFIQMLVFPIIMISLIRVIINLQTDIDITALIRKTLFWLMLTTGIAAIIGIFLATAINLGQSLTVIEGHRASREVKNIVDVLLGIIPSNPIVSIVNNNVIAIVIFASMIGSSARIMKSKEKYQATMNVFVDLIEAGYRITMSMAMTVIKFMPYGVIALTSGALISNGMTAMFNALSFIIIIYLASFIMIVVYILMIAFHGLNPITFLKKSWTAWLMAFSSRSSVGSLPMTISTLEEKLGVNPSTANFVASLGSTVGMNGCAGYFPAMVAILVGSIAGVPMDLSFYIMVVLVAMLGSLGIAGIPGAATMAASIMLSGIGLSEYFPYLAIVLAIDPIIDMARTMINVAGAMTSAVCIDKELGLLNETTYNDSTLFNTEK